MIVSEVKGQIKYRMPEKNEPSSHIVKIGSSRSPYLVDNEAYLLYLVGGKVEANSSRTPLSLVDLLLI